MHKLQIALYNQGLRVTNTRRNEKRALIYDSDWIGGVGRGMVVRKTTDRWEGVLNNTIYLTIVFTSHDELYRLRAQRLSSVIVS